MDESKAAREIQGLLDAAVGLKAAIEGLERSKIQEPWVEGVIQDYLARFLYWMRLALNRAKSGSPAFRDLWTERISQVFLATGDSLELRERCEDEERG